MHQSEWHLLETASSLVWMEHRWGSSSKRKALTTRWYPECHLEVLRYYLRAAEKSLKFLALRGVVRFISRNNSSHVRKRWITPFSSGKTTASHYIMNSVPKPSSFLGCSWWPSLDPCRRSVLFTLVNSWKLSSCFHQDKPHVVDILSLLSYETLSKQLYYKNMFISLSHKQSAILFLIPSNAKNPGPWNHTALIMQMVSLTH